jgi:hypothetical protein
LAQVAQPQGKPMQGIEDGGEIDWTDIRMPAF